MAISVRHYNAAASTSHSFFTTPAEPAGVFLFPNVLVAYVRLVELGKADPALVGPLATYAVAQVRAGRRVGGHLNIRDVLSGYCQHHKGLVVEHLVRFNQKEDEWQEVLVEDKTVTPAELAASRLDFQAWLKTLSGRQRRVAKLLAQGERTKDAARRIGVSCARISHLRRELHEAWLRFHGEDVAAKVMAIV